MDKSQSETEMETLEREVLDQLENPYQPYSVIFPYDCRFTIPADGHNTEITIRTKSQEIRFGRNERDIILQKEIDNRYGRNTYAKHILGWVLKRLPDIDPRECDVEYTDTPTITLMDQQEVKDFTEGCLNDE